MKKFLFLLIVFFIATNTDISAQTKKSEIADPTKFQQIEPNQSVKSCRSSLKTCGDRALVALDLAGFGGPNYIQYEKEVFNFANGVGVYLLTIKGIKSRELSAERVRVSFVKKGSTYNFVQAGRQYLCSQGEDEGKWKMSCEIGSKKDKNPTTRDEVKNGDNFRFITVNGRAVGELTKPCYASIEVCGRTKLGIYGYEEWANELESDNVSEETYAFADKNTGKNTAIYLISMTGMEDDSVSGERIRIEFERKGKAWTVVQGGRQFQCARGTSAGKWTKELCP